MNEAMKESLVGTADHLRKFMNISERLVEINTDDLHNYKGIGHIGEASDILLMHTGIVRTKYLKSYSFTTPVDSASSIIVSGAPLARHIFSANTILPLHVSFFVALVITTAGMWFMNALIEKLLSRNGERNFVGLNTYNWFIFRFLTDILLLNSPLITKSIPHLWPRNLPSAFLYFFWLIAQTVLLWNISSHFSADATTTVYEKIETLAELERQENVKPRIVKNVLEHRVLQMLVDSKLLGKKFANMMKMDEIYLESMLGVLEDDLYTEVSERKTVFLTNDKLLLYGCCYALKYIPKGAVELHFSSKPFLQAPLFYLIHRNVSTHLQEIINQRLGTLSDSLPFEYLHFECRNIVYYRNVWEKPLDSVDPLKLEMLLVPSLLLMSSCVTGFLMSFGKHINRAVTQPALNIRRRFT